MAYMEIKNVSFTYENGFEAVSYTHLDVYKRQSMTSAYFILSPNSCSQGGSDFSLR